MKKILLSLSLITAAFSSAQINASESFESTTYPGFTNVSFFRSSVETPCAGSYGLTRNFWSGGTLGSTTYSSTSSNGGKLDISFKYKTFIYNNGSVNGTLKVEYSIDGGQNYQTLQTISLTSVAGCATWSGSLQQGTVPNSANFKLRVSGQWTSGDYWVILDDFKLTQSPFLSASDISKKTTEVYPNPFNDVLFLNNSEDVDNISIADISGRTVKTINQVSKELKLNDLKADVYVISIIYKNGTSTSDKIVKK